MQIKTNHRWNNFLYAYELTPAERAEFDHLDQSETTDGFLRYKGHVYHDTDFMWVSPEKALGILGWQGYASDSYFSGVLIRVSDNGERYQIATYFC